jgi:hypothetical protein
MRNNDTTASEYRIPSGPDECASPANPEGDRTDRLPTGSGSRQQQDSYLTGVGEDVVGSFVRIA